MKSPRATDVPATKVVRTFKGLIRIRFSVVSSAYRRVQGLQMEEHVPW